MAKIQATAVGKLQLTGTPDRFASRGPITIAETLAFLQEALARGAKPSDYVHLGSVTDQQVWVAIPAELSAVYPPEVPLTAVPTPNTGPSTAYPDGIVPDDASLHIDTAVPASVSDIMSEFVDPPPAATRTKRPWTSRSSAR